VKRPDSVQREPVFLVPMKELVTGPCISQAGIPVSDSCGEEFNIGVGSPRAGWLSEMIADLFEGQPLRNQSSRTGGPQTVGSVMSALHVERLQSGGHHVVQATT
jgi:hypothetical protein